MRKIINWLRHIYPIGRVDLIQEEFYWPKDGLKILGFVNIRFDDPYWVKVAE